VAQQIELDFIACFEKLFAQCKVQFMANRQEKQVSPQSPVMANDLQRLKSKCSSSQEYLDAIRATTKIS
jgi:hypothetical protein